MRGATSTDSAPRRSSPSRDGCRSRERSATEVLARQVTEPPPALASLGLAVPRKLALLVDRCLAKPPDHRPGERAGVRRAAGPGTRTAARVARGAPRLRQALRSARRWRHDRRPLPAAQWIGDHRGALRRDRGIRDAPAGRDRRTLRLSRECRAATQPARVHPSGSRAPPSRARSSRRARSSPLSIARRPRPLNAICRW